MLERTEAEHTGPHPHSHERACSRPFAKGLLVQLLNQKIAIFFLAVLPQFVKHGPVAAQTLILGTLFTLVAVLSDGAHVLMAGRARSWLLTGRRGQGLARLSGCVYIGLGVVAALTGRSHVRASRA